MSEGTRYVGLDVHKEWIVAAVADSPGDVQEFGRVANEANEVRRLVKRLERPGWQLRACYEAGPTGYPLQRYLSGLGVDTVVVAPSLIPVRPGDRVKTDRRDAAKLARLLRSGDLTPVWIPDEQHEALRDLLRARDDARTDDLRAKHRLTKFLLRRGVPTPTNLGRPWGQRHHQWLNQLRFDDPAVRVTFDDYLATVRTAGERVRRLDVALADAAPRSRLAPVIQALQAFRGISFLSAVTIVAEAGDLHRFATAPQLMAFIGLVPSEYSSGDRRIRGRITKTGNRLMRHVLGEAAHHARHQPLVSDTLRRRQAGTPPAVTELAWRCQQRLHHKYLHLGGRIGRNRALIAVAREFAGFIWAAGQLVEVPAA
ncbi:MAG: IS110 family transposase [Candidatus Dormibacteraeota bacterium]|jgi:transposase|nr:IS110 family transposase [Candidatus Dormibacteraeota bacterium]